MISIRNKFNKCLVKIPMLVDSVVSKILVKSRAVVNYQPMLGSSFSKRLCRDRLQVIKENISDGNLCLDIGCNTGYFSSNISKLGIFTIGMDSELKNIIVARSQYSAPNLIFMQFELNKNSVQLLPSVDIILFLSVFHHLVKDYGKNDAVIILKTLASKCNKCFFFETGQPDEIGTKWARMMEFLGETNTWVNKLFIEECKFREVRYLGKFKTFLTATKRKLFAAFREE